MPLTVDFPVELLLVQQQTAGFTGQLPWWIYINVEKAYMFAPPPPQRSEHLKCPFLQSHIYKFHFLPEGRSHNVDIAG